MIGAPRRAAELFFEQNVLGRHPTLRDGALDEQQKMVGINRLGQEVERPFLHRRHRVLNAAKRGHHDDRKLRIEVLGRTQDPESVSHRQPQV